MKPLGLADVIYDKMAWSTKTVTAAKPLTSKKVRLISGRNDILFSFGINDYARDLTTTGTAVLEKMFTLRKPAVEFEAIIERLNFDSGWVTIL
jgi:hypothetical protein